MNNNEIMLSITVPTYGQERYISQALDSILMQKTQYSFEVLVGEDASPDNTRKILKDYEKKYPGFFTMIYRDENMKGKNSYDLMCRARGKYLITLEGDDFWTDENKLEKQISFLESHPEYMAVAHNCVVVDENSNPNGERYHECKSEEYTLEHFFYDIMPGQLATVMQRNYMRDDLFDTSILNKGLVPGDRLIYFALVCNGKVHCIQETMSAYRHITTHGTSFSASYRFNFEREENWYKELINYARRLNNEQAVRIAEACYGHWLFMSLKRKNISFSQFKTLFNKIPHRGRVTALSVRKKLNKNRHDSF